MIIHFDDTELEVLVDDNSYRRRAVKEKDKLVLYYSLTHHVEIPVGAWVEYEGQVYSLFKASNFTKNSTRNFSYTLTLESGWAGAEKYKVKNPVDGRLKFPYTAKPHEFIQLIVDNMNMRESGWEVGECIDAVEQVISFNHAYCSDALNQIADAFDTEWEVEGKTIHLRKVEYFKDNPLALSYGKGNGFKKEISRSNKSDSRNFEILYVQGGTDNIVPSKYGNSELLLPKSQTLVHEGVSYLSSVDGRYITQKGKELVSKAEDSLDCSDIYPKRVGSVTSVIEVDKGKHFYDFIDSTIPEELNFSDCLIEGETMTVIPQSGMLVGKEFDVKYKHAERRFEIVPQDIDGETMPNDIYKLAVGDKYAVFHVALPDAYVCNNSDKSGASWDMFREAARFFYENTGELFTFKGELDGIWAKKDWLNIGGRIKPGGYVLFSDEQFHPEGSLVRITSVKDFCNNPHSPTIELSNAPISSSFQSSMNKVEETEVVIDNKHREAIQYTKRRFKDSQETIEMLKDAMLENFTDAISPIAVQTMSMLIGDESLQFRFVSDKTNPQPIVHNVTYNQTTKVLTVPAGIIQHMTLGIKTVSSSHKAGEYKFWSIPAFETPPLTDGDKKYYLYAKVSKVDQTGVFYISETAIAMESIEGYYYLLMGILNSEYDGERSYVSLYGFSEILPGRITTDKIVSSDGKTSFDLLQGIISGHITFQSGSSGLENLAEWSGKQQQIDNAQQIGQEAQATANSADRKAQQAKDYIDNTLPGELSEINKRLDGVVENWFYPYTPSLYNEPAQTWIADGEQENHIGDTFTNTLPANFDPTDAGCWEQGSIGASYIDGIKTWDQIKIADSTRIRLKTPVGGIPKGAVLSVGEGYTMGYNPIASSGAVIASYVWSQSYTVGSDNPYMAFVIRKTDNAKITPAEYPQIHFTISSDETTNPDAGKSWRWVKEEDGTYKWTPIADSDAVKALQEAARAQDTADAKRRVFVVTPTTPYDVGDIWTQGEGGDIMRCIESRATGNFESSDWDKASKYTDDTAANEAKERLAAMSSDGTLSKEEKPAVRQQWSQIQKEYAKYQTDATSFGVSITALKGAYDALAAYLSSIGLTSDTDTTIVPDTFNQKFADYYAEVSRFSNLVAQKQADEAVDNLQVGARNYIAKVYISDWNNNSQGKTDIVLTGSDTDGSYQSVNYRAVQEIISSGDSTRADIFRGRIKFQENMQYSFKVRWKLLYEMSSTVRGMYFVFIYTDGTMEFVPIYGNQTSLVETVYSTKEGKTLDRISASYSQFDAGGKTNRVLIYDIQLTEGNKAPTGYITAEEDVQAQIEQVKLDVDYIASDSSLTPSDKQQVANEWVRIQNEYWSIIANAAKYDVPTDTFTTYFQRLEDYLTPLLADMSTTSEITGTEFRKLFSDYYEVSSTMSDLIDDAIDESIKSTEYLKQAMEDGSTEVKGGLVMTNVMLMKNRQGEVTAGVSGLQEDDVPFWSGADYTNRKKAVFRVHADGEVHATKGTIGIMQVKNDSVEVSDATASGNKIILTTNNINSVSQVLGSSDVPSSQTTESVSVITSQTKPFASDFKTSKQFQCGAEVQMSAQVKGTIRGGGSVKIEIFNQTANTTDTIFRQSSADAGTGSIQINKSISYRFMSPVGTPTYYYIKVSVEASSSGELGSTASAAVEAITFSFVTDVRKNLIAPNGVAVVKGSSNYAVFTGDIFEVLIGKAGLRIQNGYVYKKDTDHTTWTKI